MPYLARITNYYLLKINEEERQKKKTKILKVYCDSICIVREETGFIYNIWDWRLNATIKHILYISNTI